MVDQQESERRKAAKLRKARRYIKAAQLADNIANRETDKLAWDKAFDRYMARSR